MNTFEVFVKFYITSTDETEAYEKISNVLHSFDSQLYETDPSIGWAASKYHVQAASISSNSV